MNTGVQKHLSEVPISFSLGMYSEEGLLDHVVVVLISFRGTFTLFSIVAAPFYIPTDSVQRFPFLDLHLHLLSFFEFLCTN